MAQAKLLPGEEDLPDLSISIILDKAKFVSATDERDITENLGAAADALAARGGLEPTQYFRLLLLQKVLAIPGGYPLAVMRGGEDNNQERLSIAVAQMPKDKLMRAESISYLSPWQDIPDDAPTVVLYTAAAPVTPVSEMPLPQNDVGPGQEALFEIPPPLPVFDNQQPPPEFVAYVLASLSSPIGDGPRHDLSRLYYPNPTFTHPDVPNSSRAEYPVVDRELAFKKIDELLGAQADSAHLVNTEPVEVGAGAYPHLFDKVASVPRPVSAHGPRPHSR
ncbi:MAG: hypothetical protein HOQ05_10985 [Corynebacteriales bacterium]|nr:hypothetical protein [Mycobacteriales bacterium]